MLFFRDSKLIFALSLLGITLLWSIVAQMRYGYLYGLINLCNQVAHIKEQAVLFTVSSKNIIAMEYLY